MLKFNYHNHSTYCDGKSSLEEMTLSAIEKGLSYYGFSAHSPVPFDNDFALQYSDIQNYLDETLRLKAKYQDKIKLFTSMEFDYIPKLSEDIRERAEEYDLDYIISSVHLVNSENGLWFIDGSKQESYDNGLRDYFGGDIRKAVKAFYDQTNEMIINVKPNIVGHFDKVKMHNKDRYFKEDETWYRDLVIQTIDLMKEEDLICEVNARGLYKGRSNDYFPQTAWVKELAKRNVRVTISSDSHKADEVDMLFVDCWDHLKACGHKEVWYFDDNWKSTSL